jgi:hypothetical protein
MPLVVLGFLYIDTSIVSYVLKNITNTLCCLSIYAPVIHYYSRINYITIFYFDEFNFGKKKKKKTVYIYMDGHAEEFK